MPTEKEQQEFLKERNYQVVAHLPEATVKMLIWALGHIDATALYDMSVYTLLRTAEKVHKCRVYFDKVGQVYKALTRSEKTVIN